jgi:16S rRNA (cytidine1402-2'-O)-methyltransferase
MQESPQFRISLVALPLGCVDDLSPRARARLSEATHVFCEDTRKLRDLARRAGIEIHAELSALPGDSERDFDWSRERARSDKNARWVLVSDAGTPIVNDPGRSLLHFARREGIEVEAVPGPSAPVLAWQWSGGFGLPFLFSGFAPKVKSRESRELESFFAGLDSCASFCFFDTKHQVSLTLEHLVARGLGDRPMFVAREMTKTHEELLSGSVSDLKDRIEAKLNDNEGVGELTLILQGELSRGARATQTSTSPWTPQELAKLRTLPPKVAAKLAAQKTGLELSDIYKAFAAAREDADE